MVAIEGSVALITGAGSGIGRGAALVFARAGATVVAVDINQQAADETVDLLKREGGSGCAVRADVSSPQDVQAALARAIADFGRIDTLVNNAGYALTGPVTDIDPADWDDIMAVNVKGVFLGCKYTIPYMLRQGHGAIVNTASTAGLRGIEQMSAYAATKGAVVLFTYSLAREYATQNIRVNCVCPGSVDTPALARWWATFPDPRARREASVNSSPMRRMAEPEEIGRAMLFLASDAASYVTGVALPVDAGMTSGGGAPPIAPFVGSRRTG
jgi:meso-butanediol dehydrogenase / (S,S)-butanediol dehydrogenase / diacetyl reductase